MSWHDICNMCCGNRQAFWDKLARQLQRYRYCSEGHCSEEPMHPIPARNNEPMDVEAFAFMGFFLLPVLFVLFGLFQRISQRRRDLTQGKPQRHSPPPTPPLD